MPGDLHARAPAPNGYTYDLFVVYAAADASFVTHFLLPALGLPEDRVLLVDRLTLGAPLVSEIAAGIDRSRFTIAVLSPAYLEDRWAVFGDQLASHLSIGDVRIIPLHLTACALPLHLKFRVSLDFTDRDRWNAEAARLRELLHTPPPPVMENAPCPYPGMRPFTEHEASRFFGRANEIAELIARLDHGEREVYVIGPSGSGKSSLVHAGLLHVLSAGSSRLQRSFAVRTMRPDERPSETLARTLERGLPAAGPTIDALVARQWPAESLLIFIDQLEEMFTLADATERQRFIAMLRGLRSEPRCYLLFALRADFYGALMDSELWPEIGSISRIDVAPLRGKALRQAIVEPAVHAGVQLEPRLCDRLVADAAAEPGVLPLVQETLRMLWEMRSQQTLGLREYEALGEHSGSALHAAIARQAEATMRTLNAMQQAMARRILLRLVSFGEGRPDTRRQQRVQALRSVGDDATEFAWVLRRLVEGRLVTVDGRAGADDALADLSHEAVITAWPGFRDWIARRRADEQQRRRLDTKLSEWIERGRGVVSLLDAVEIREAVDWMQSDAARELGYQAELPAFVTASENEIAKAQQQVQDARRVVGLSYLDRGHSLLLDECPMRALPYLVLARAESIDSPVLRMLFAEASAYLPLLTFVGHSGAVTSVECSADDRLLVTGSEDGTALIWNAATGDPVTPRLEHDDRVRASVFSPDGRFVATASDDHSARVWSVSSGEAVTPPLRHEGPVLAVAFSPNGALVVSTSADHTARIWDACTGQLVTPPLQHEAAVTAAAFHPGGTRLATASRDGTAKIWEAATGKLASSPLVHQATVLTVAFNPDGTRMITGSDDNLARIWVTSSGKLANEPLVHRGAVFVAVFSPDGGRVLTASGDHTARIWLASTSSPITPALPHRAPVRAAAFHRDGTTVVTASEDNTARVWDATTGMPAAPPFEHQGRVHAAVFSRAGTCVITASDDKMARMWSVSPRKQPTVALSHRETVHVAAFSADGARVVTASEDGTARIWDAATGAPTTPALEHRSTVIVASFSPDGRLVVTASDDCTARIWDAATGDALTPPLVHPREINSAMFSPDGRRVVTAGDDANARIWNVSTGALAVPPLEHHDNVHSATFSADGTRVITASWDHTARIWNAWTGEPVTRPLEHRGFVHSAVFSQDGTRVVTASLDNTARIWCTATSKPTTPPLEHQGFVYAAMFSPDGKRVVTVSWDHTARIWDAATGKPATPPLAHNGAVRTAAFSPDGTRVVTASEDKTARVWHVSTGEPVTQALEHDGFVLTATFSPDGTCVVTASDDRTTRIWDAATGRPVTSPLHHGGSVRAAAFSPDGTRIVTASDDRTAQIWTPTADFGSLAAWHQLALCCPFVLVKQVLTANPHPPRIRPL